MRGLGEGVGEGRERRSEVGLWVGCDVWKCVEEGGEAPGR